MAGRGGIRVIAGSAGGTRLLVPRVANLRPTTDRARETLFNVLAPRVAGSRVLDLFAGTGALGVEALSRGAAAALFVERDRGAAGGVEQNLQRCHLEERAEVRCTDWSAALRQLGQAGRCFDIVFLDPPYRSSYASECLEQLQRAGIVGQGGLVVLEHRRGSGPEMESSWRLERELRVGETAFWLLDCVTGGKSPC